MGVPAFYRWLSEKYPKITVDMLEERPKVVAGTAIPTDLTGSNPNGIEYDNLYIDMNGIIHPCSHPEDAPPPETEEQMYLNVTKYVDRLVAAVRPRRLLFLAIDGTAPRAKMNQQRARRFKSAQEARERAETMKEVRAELEAMGHALPPEKAGEWDSNVITPGTPFMAKLSRFLRFYIRDRMNKSKYWQGIKVIFSDAQEPGEGEHKIMAFVRRQRCQPGYDANQHHILHGLDADLIMLGLATHEARFTILREEVTFGRRNEEMRKVARAAAEEAAALTTGREVSGAWPGAPEDAWLTQKPLQRLELWTLREYLRAEFQCLESALPFEYDFERVVDDFVFLCFFVGNDFLPHLPSLDIRDGALDFLFNVYKRCLPGMGGYLTNPGGEVNLAHVDQILREVGAIEDEVFRRRKEAERREEHRREQYKRQQKQGGADRMAAMAVRDQATPVGRGRGPRDNDVSFRKAGDGSRIPEGKGVGMDDARNKAASALLVASFAAGGGAAPASNKEAAAALKRSLMAAPEAGPAAEALSPEELADAQKAMKDRMKEKLDEQLTDYRKNVNDTVRLWEHGWKDRFYADKFKNEDIAKGGGREKVFASYVEGLCWVLRYYYQGCASWKWYYPFHYAPFASDLVDIARYKASFDESKPFKPIHQLMAVLPSDSAPALPEPCRWLMCDPESPIIDFYPKDVPCDPNGKAMPWLWVVLLPFIDEKRLLDALAPAEAKFTTEETQRNSYGPGYLFVHSSHPGFQDILKCYEQDETRALEGGKFESLTGFVTKSTQPEMAIAMNEPVEAPKQPPGALEDIRANEVAAVEYALPPAGPHLCRLLDGAEAPASPLTPQDLLPRRPPRLSRGGMSIAELGGAPFQRHVRHALGMGGSGGGRGGGGYNQAHTQRGRYAEEGWGTLEPHTKRQRFGGGGGGGPGGLLGQPPPREPCRFFQQGRCSKGTGCRFSHEAGALGGSIGGPGGLLAPPPPRGAPPPPPQQQGYGYPQLGHGFPGQQQQQQQPYGYQAPQQGAGGGYSFNYSGQQAAYSGGNVQGNTGVAGGYGYPQQGGGYNVQGGAGSLRSQLGGGNVSQNGAAGGYYQQQHR